MLTIKKGILGNDDYFYLSESKGNRYAIVDMMELDAYGSISSHDVELFDNLKEAKEELKEME